MGKNYLLNSRWNKQGMTLVEVLVSFGIMGILLYGVMTIQVNQRKEVQSLTESLAANDLHKILTASLSNGSVCKYILNNPVPLTFDSTVFSGGITSSPPVLTPSLPIYASVNPGPPVLTGPVLAQVNSLASTYSQTLKIQNIKLVIIGAPSVLPPPGPGVTFTGNWMIEFDPLTSVRPMKPLSIITTLSVDTTIPTSAKITDCMSSGNSTTSGDAVVAPTPATCWTCNNYTCPSGYTLVWYHYDCHCSNNATWALCKKN